VRARARALKEAISFRPFQPLYAIKANPCPAVAKAIVGEGFGIDAVSPGEVAMALRLGVKPGLVLYTENNMDDGEQAEAVSQGVLITCGSLDRLERLGKAGVSTCAVRFNPDVGAGAHEKICTAGPLTKFGVHHSETEAVLRIERETGIQVVGCHMHIGSGILDADVYVRAMAVILSVAEKLPHLRFIDFGGGIGIPYRADQDAMDLARLGREASRLMEDVCQRIGRRIELRLEPGRFLVAEAGTLYTTVTSVKTNPDTGRIFVGCDSGFNHLIRPAMYDAYHRIENVTNPHGVATKVDVVGNICESGDIFGRDRVIPAPRVGDLLAIREAGAYGFAMASTYNLRPLPAEVVVDKGVAKLVRERQRMSDLLDAWEW
jgi:diaminopimelate decarboxylase